MSDEAPVRATPTTWLAVGAILWAVLGIVAWIYTWPKGDGGSGADKVGSLMLLFTGLGLATVCAAAVAVVAAVERRDHEDVT